MSKSLISLDAPEKRVLMMGNHAVARGAVEGGVRVAASYPGTPASEILEALGEVANELGFHAQWSVNEMVAIEAAIGAALVGAKSMVSCKHLGVNWGMDPLMHICQWPILTAGMVLASGDDPKGHSSANEQDNRILGEFMEIPVLEPSDVQEAKDYTVRAFEISEALRTPVMVRLTTRVCHASGDVTLGPIPKARKKPEASAGLLELYTEAIMSGRSATEYAHQKIHAERLPKAREISDSFPGNRLRMDGGEELAVVASGVCRLYAREALDRLGLSGKVAFLEVGMSNPLPTTIATRLLSNVSRVLVFEETEPFIERNLRVLAQQLNLRTRILGKATGNVAAVGELDADLCTESLAKTAGLEFQRLSVGRSALLEELRGSVPPRMVALCPACSHRCAAYAFKQAIQEFNGGQYFGVGDIGCYAMLLSPPQMMFHALLCMGGSIGLANGSTQTGLEAPTVSFIGDSTFFHAGIPGLINAVFNRAEAKIVILDNSVTGMTGFQPHPGTGVLATGEQTTPMKIEDLVRACGAQFVEVVDPYNMRKTKEVMLEALKSPGVAVVVCRRLCSTEQLRQWRRRGIEVKPFAVDPEACNGCRICIETYGCPAISWDSKAGKAFIDDALCRGCGTCIQVCEAKAIKPSRGGG